MPDEELNIETPEPEEDREFPAGREQDEVPDPGQLEGTRKSDHRDNEPPKDSPRWNQIYAKMKDYERDREALQAKLSEKDAVMDEVRKHNAKLMERMEELSNKALDTLGGKRDESPAELPEIQALSQTIDQLEEQKAQALEALDSKTVIKIDKEIRKLERMIDNYESKKRSDKPKEQDKPKPKQPSEPPPEVIEFMDASKDWFGRDPLMTGAAMEYEKYLSLHPDHRGKSHKEILKKVKEDIEVVFSRLKSSGKDGNRGKPPAPESGIGLQKPGASSRTVKLSQDEVRVAQGLGLSVEDYAKQ